MTKQIIEEIVDRNRNLQIKGFVQGVAAVILVLIYCQFFHWLGY